MHVPFILVLLLGLIVPLAAASAEESAQAAPAAGNVYVVEIEGMT